MYIELEPNGTLYLQPDRVLSAQLSPESQSRDLRLLLRTNAALLAAADRHSFVHTLLNSAIELTSADRGGLLKPVGDLGEFIPIACLDRLARPAELAGVNARLLERVLRSGISFVSNAAAGISDKYSTLAVPLAAFKRIHGAIYLESLAPYVRFSEDVLRLVAAIGAMAGVMLERAGGLEPVIGEADLNFGIEHAMLGRSPQIQEVCRFIARIAPVETTVLVHGESGTGKELVVRALHQNSSRSKGPFVALNCAALTDTLLESELFGHEKGAFTGAAAQKKGLIEEANGGTFFLDELGELAPPLQAKLLRAVQERTVLRLGGIHPIPVNVRVIAATNKNLAQEVRNGTFRQDLYYRLNVVSVKMPPLRERGDDIILLANHFLARYARESGRFIQGMSPAVCAILAKYDWPGNVRELQNAMQHAVLLSNSDLIGPADLPGTLHNHDCIPSEGGLPGYHSSIAELKKQMLRQAIEQAGGNLTEAAKQLGVHRNYVYRLVRRMKLKDKEVKSA